MGTYWHPCTKCGGQIGDDAVCRRCGRRLSRGELSAYLIQWRRTEEPPFEPTYASLGARLLAVALDAALLFGFLVAGGNAGLSATLAIAVVLAYMPVMWWLLGASLGQKALGIRIVDGMFGRRIGPFTAALRAAIWYLELAGCVAIFGIFGFLEAAMNPRRQAWHDKVAATVVISGRGRASG